MPRQHLTPNACLVCRKKRTKCDGQTPCRRCRSRGEECAYEDKKWRTKDHLRSEIERLRTEQRQGHAVIRALINDDSQMWEAVLDRIRDREHPDSIAQWVQSTLGHPTMTPRRPTLMGLDDPTPGAREHPYGATVLGDRFSTPNYAATGGRLSFPSPSPTSFDRCFSTGIASSGQYTFQGPRAISFSPPLCSGGPGLLPMGYRGSIQSCTSDSSQSTDQDFPAWTRITSDTHLVRRLISRAFAGGSFCTLPLISRLPFMKDAFEGGRRYCSEALVNALLGWSCKMLAASSQPTSQVTFGDAFLGEAKMLLSAEQSHVTIPSIQAFGILAWCEMCQGNEGEACNLIQESVRSSIHLALQTRPEQLDEDFRDSLALAYCGGFTQMRMLRLLTGQLEPNTGPLFMRLQSGPGDSGHDTPAARVERGISLQLRFFSEIRFCPPIARFVFEISETVHTFLSYNFSKSMTATDLEDAYAKCIHSHVRFGDQTAADITSTPDLLFAHIWYHYCLLCLFRPYVNSTASLVGGETPRLLHGVTPSSICRQSSEAVIYLTSSFQMRHSLRYPPPLLPHVVFAAILHQLTLLVQPGGPQPAPPHFDRRSALMQMPTASASPCPPPPHTLAPQFPSPASVGPPQELSQGLPRPRSPSITIPAQRGGRRRASAMSSVSMCTSASSDHILSGASSYTSRAASDRGEGSSSDAGVDMLPAFTSAPADLVTVGSLQLVSMGAQHIGAARAARAIHSVGSVEDLAGSGIDLSVWARSLALQVDEFMASTVWTGLGLERDPVDSPGSLVGLGVLGYGGPVVGNGQETEAGSVLGMETRTPVCAI